MIVNGYLAASTKDESIVGINHGYELLIVWRNLEMEKMCAILIVCISTILSGCASSIYTFHNRAVVEDSLKDSAGTTVVGTLSVTAARRIALVKLEGENRGKFCAEPPPDVSENISTALDAAINAKLASIPIDTAISDKLKVEAVVLTTRTALLDIYRTGTYSLCQYYLNGAISGSELNTNFNELTTNVINAMSKGLELEMKGNK